MRRFELNPVSKWGPRYSTRVALKLMGEVQKYAFIFDYSSTLKWLRYLNLISLEARADLSYLVNITAEYVAVQGGKISLATVLI